MPRVYRPIAAFLTALAVTGCTGTPTVQTGPDAETIDGRLYRVDNTAAQLVYVDPTADFTRYKHVLLAPLGVDNVEIIQPDNSSRPGARRREWQLTDEDRAALQTSYREVMVQELVEKGGYALANAPADDVLEITAMLTQLAPTAPKDDNRSRSAGRSEVYTEGAGSIAVAVAFADSETGEVLALSKDKRRSAQHWGLNNRVSNRAEVRRVFSAWARQIRSGLDRVLGGASEE
jgi:hypothetical protein